MSYGDVMRMPLKAFWAFSGNITRISAERDLRQLQLLGSSQSGEGFTTCFDRLKEEHGSPVVVVDKRRDEDALDKLKNLLG